MQTHYHAYLNTFSREMLPVFQQREDIGKRYREISELYGIELRVEKLYAVMADAVINRDLAKTERKFSDANLDSAASISLNADAPLTAQFFIEDHALRHSFLHLENIKKALNN